MRRRLISDPPPLPRSLRLGCRSDHAGRHRQALHQPRQRPAADHPWRAVRRCRHGQRRDLGAHRPAGPHAGRDRHHRQLPRRAPGRVRRRAAGERLHRQGAARGPAGRAGHLLPHRFQDHSSPTILERADGRPLPHRAGRPALGLVRLGRRRRRPGLGHRRGARRHAHVRDHAAQPAGFLHPFRRHDLRRRSAAGRGQARRTAKSGRTSSPRRSRRPPRRSTSSAATTNTT